MVATWNTLKSEEEEGEASREPSVLEFSDSLSLDNLSVQPTPDTLAKLRKLEISFIRCPKVGGVGLKGLISGLAAFDETLTDFSLTYAE